MTIQIYDGMAVLRRRFNENVLGNRPRGVITEMLSLPKTDIAVWAFEGQGSLTTRRKVFPGYKVRPPTMDDGLFDLIKLTRDAMRHTRALQVDVPGFEADDVIAHLCQTHGVGGDKVVVHTIDRDLKALQTGNVKIDCGDMAIKVDDQESRPLPANQIRLYKTLVGDSSDKIPGMAGFGPKAYLACNPAILRVALDDLLAGRPDPQRFVMAGVKQAMAERMCAPAQAELLRAYHTVIGFMPLPDDWEQHVVVGREDPRAADAILKEFMH